MPYQDPAAATEDRVADLLGRMTIEEKLAQLGCVWVAALIPPTNVLETIPHGIGQITRIGASTGLRPAASATLMNDIQRAVVEGTRLGIPVLVHEESTGGFCARDATVFPQGLGLASTWDPGLVEDIAKVIRAQMLAVGARQTLAPVLDVARDPRWGRVEETYGEDPVLIGTIGTAYVRGIQGSDLREGVIATGKHFLGYAISEGGLNSAPVQLGPRELREVYAEPFSAVIRDAGLASMMNSYSSIDGDPCAGSHAILTGLLRDELGFTGMVVADYGAVDRLRWHHRVAADRGAAGVRALSAGLDVELPATECYEPGLMIAAIDRGELSMEVVDEAVRRTLRAKFSLGLFEKPYVDASVAGAVYQTAAQRTLARRAVAESVVLLSNDGVLPLDPASRIAVVGPLADDVRLLQGDYHYPTHLEIVIGRNEELGEAAPGMFFSPHVTPLKGIRAIAPDTVHAAGCGVSGDDLSGIEAAVALAASASVAVVCVGGRSGLVPDSTVGEARDATDLRLTGVQESLVSAVVATGTPTVVAVISGRVHTLASVVEAANALLWMAPPGEEAGHGLADVLFGVTDPGGRLPVSLPRHVGQVPVYAAHRAGGGLSTWYRDYTDSPASPLFAFGHGLSYTTWDYSDLKIKAGARSIAVSVRVTNSGRRYGSEVVQLYMTDRVASVARPVRQLVGFTRVSCEPGQRATVTFEVHLSRLAFYDSEMRFVVEPGEFGVRVGGLDGRVTLEGSVREYLQREVVATTADVSLS